MGERELIERARSGNLAAERELYDTHVDRVFRLAYRMTGRQDLAEDMTQDAFIRAFSRLADFRGEAAFSTWIHSIAVSVILNGLRKVKRIHQRETDLQTAEEIGGEGERADPDLKERLAAAIDRLPDGYRMVFVMHDIEGYTHEEIGQALGLATGSSKARLSRARARLREALSAYAGEWLT